MISKTTADKSPAAATTAVAATVAPTGVITKPAPDLTPKNPEQFKKAIALGKDMTKQMAINPEITKATIARAMYALIHAESREVIAQAFVDGAALTPKGAMTYYYNTKRKAAKEAKTTGSKEA